MSNPEASGVIIRNNICSQNLSFQVALDPAMPTRRVTMDHNLIDGFRNDSAEIRGEEYLERAPGFENAAAALMVPNNPGNGWKVAGTGDFNADRAIDLAFQHTDGTLAVWYLNGIHLTGATLLTPANPGDAAWRVVSVADRNRDSKLDLLFQNSTDGTLALWIMDGVNLSQPQLLNPSNAGGTWSVAAP